MRKQELIDKLSLYEGDPDVIFSFASLDYDNIDISEYEGQIIIDICEMDYKDYDYLEL